jgi:hypothetical protein
MISEFPIRPPQSRFVHNGPQLEVPLVPQLSSLDSHFNASGNGFVVGVGVAMPNHRLGVAIGLQQAGYTSTWNSLIEPASVSSST